MWRMFVQVSVFKDESGTLIILCFWPSISGIEDYKEVEVGYTIKYIILELTELSNCDIVI